MQFIKAEIRILRSKLTSAHYGHANKRRQLLRYGKPLGSAILQLLTIVS